MLEKAYAHRGWPSIVMSNAQYKIELRTEPEPKQSPAPAVRVLFTAGKT